ncbi:DUF4255 domain-containing protein [Aquimarina sp. MMG015]|uniref:DUF4255 domain-containing protein n=1 Tax=unclassified Aquimarina TaxID=2627091 RepID=UPI000E48179C|nr:MULTISPECIES: DUF4255 domain-containing protein [unclassified Aquimarina]AXT55878.1 DUF4255 domain-containing protein [Aquimarina sp. AD1]MBQ4805319.1 DUF4255 domain-containing protein [Aquimarina sp. MMG015]RKN29343.1 DUF4255 domain-containing protein [Aquimarina sp. AD1]
MIFEVLQIITEEVNNFFNIEIEEKPVSLDNIAFVESEDDEPSDSNNIVLSLLHTEEESTLKNILNHKIEGTKVVYKNNKVNLNLYIMFSANRNDYKESLKSISRVVEFFQSKKIFTQSNTNFDRDLDGMDQIGDFKFTTELFTPSFEEMNFIWGTLGGKQYPSVIYKVSVLEIERDVTQSEGSLITEINGSLKRN